jgi:regulator of protease activity HflC (stomatin/prohibitin superfamily)
MERNVQSIGIVNWVALLIVGVCCALVAQYAGSAAGLTGTVFLGIGLLVALVSFVQMRERVERLEYDELRKSRSASTLFAEAGAETLLARRSREQFEKYLVPAFTILLFALQGGAAWWGWERLATASPPVVGNAPVAIAFYGLFFLVLFLLGKYSGGIARINGQRLLRPAAGYLMLGAIVCLILAAVEAAIWFGAPKSDLHVARALCVVLGLAAGETLLGLVFELYRPRSGGGSVRLLYESRLVGLLGQPTGLFTTAAQALDYQFGFKVSETWFYKFLEQALARIILLQLAALFLSTCFVIIDPSEQGLLERFGKPVPGRAVLEPGWRLKYPWPIDTVRRYSTRETHEFVVGPVADQALEKERTVTWTRPHYKEESNMLVASRDPVSRTDTGGAEKAVPANLLSASIPFQYRIVKLPEWAYNFADARSVLEDLASDEVCRYLVSVDMETIMSSGRKAAAEEIRRRVQQRADRFKLGVEIVFVGLQDIHPPVGTKTIQVAAAFEAVVGALQQKETNILMALAYAAEKGPSAQAEATNLLSTARADQVTKVAVAAAEAGQFGNRMAAYRASPTVYTQRSYLEALSRSIPAARKYILAATNTQDTFIFNLEDKIREDLLNTILPPDTTKSAETKQ